MRTGALLVVALASLAGGALAAARALTQPPATPPGLSMDAPRPLFRVENLRHGDRFERCVAVTNEGPGQARGFVLGRVEAGDLARHLGVAVTRGCAGGAVVFSGALTELDAVPDGDWPAGERRRFGIAVEVTGSDAAVQGRRAAQEFGFGVEALEGAGTAAPPAETAASEGVGRAAVPSEVCASLTFAPARWRTRRRPVLIKRHRVDARVTAKLILRIYGAAGRQRLVLVTGLRVGRKVLPGRRWGRVAYRVGRGAAVTSRRRPFRIRVAPGALKPGRNVVRVTVVPRRGRPVRARYVLRIAASAGGAGCEIG